MLGGQGMKIDSRQLQMSRPAVGLTQSPVQRVWGTLFPRVKQQMCESDRSPQSGPEVKNELTYTSATHIWLHIYCPLLRVKTFLVGLLPKHPAPHIENFFFFRN